MQNVAAGESTRQHRKDAGATDVKMVGRAHIFQVFKWCVRRTLRKTVLFRWVE
jgi:hypothetical protein